MKSNRIYWWLIIILNLLAGWWVNQFEKNFASFLFGLLLIIVNIFGYRIMVRWKKSLTRFGVGYLLVNMLLLGGWWLVNMDSADWSKVVYMAVVIALTNFFIYLCCKFDERENC